MENQTPLSSAAQLGIQLGLQNALSSSQVKSLNKWFSFDPLKYYFDVSHKYVVRKLLLVIFPFTQKRWQRLTDSSGYQSARDDVNAPDMYIPSMAFITYVMLVGLISGTSTGKFRPELLWMTASTALIFATIEVAFVKIGCYFLNAKETISIESNEESVSLLDLMAISGYKFVPIVVCQIVGLISRKLKWISFVALSMSLAFFVLRSLRRIVGSAGVDGGKRRKGVNFLFGIVIIQTVCSYFLVKWSFD